MSWSVTFIGNPENIKKALDEYSKSLTGTSKEEFDVVLPSFHNILDQNYSEPIPPVLKFNANGHAWKNVEKGYSNCQVTVETIGGTLV